MIRLEQHRDGVVLNVRVQPGAKQTAWKGGYGEGVKIAVAAPPEGGKANEALLRRLADDFGLRREAVELLAGAGARSKRVLLRGTVLELVRERLAELLRAGEGAEGAGGHS